MPSLLVLFGLADERPVVPLVAEHWYDEVKVTQPGDNRRGWPLLKLLGAMGTTFGRLHDVVRDTDQGPGWSSVLDPDRCPGWALPWLAQFAGVKLIPGQTEAEQRAQITSPPAFLRGTRQGMGAAVGATLTGSTFTATVTKGSRLLSAPSSTANVSLRSLLTGPGIPPGAEVVGWSATSVVIDQPARDTIVAAPINVVRVVENVDLNAYRLAVITSPATTSNPVATTAAARSQKPLSMLLTTYVSAAPLLMEYTRQLSSVTATLNAATLADVI